MRMLLAGCCALAFGAAPVFGQAIGSLDNFDCVNDTGVTAEGFEIEVEDISPSDITRAFPSNFVGQEQVQRFGLPTIVAFDDTAIGGKKGVRIRWAATWDGSKWVARYGSFSSDGVAYVPKAPPTQGDSCWLYGQGASYAYSGCDHFGLSFGLSAAPGAIHYHWLVPDTATPGTLTQAQWTGMGPIPPAPIQVYVAPVAGVPAAVQAVVHAVEALDPADPPEPQWGDAVWVHTYTSQAPQAADLNALQAGLVPVHNDPVKHIKVKSRWALLQRAPAGAEAAEKVEQENDKVEAGKVAVVKRYVYYHYVGVYDPETHEAICAPELLHSNGPCTSGPRTYRYTDPVTGATRRVIEKGKFYGAHNAAFNLP